MRLPQSLTRSVAAAAILLSVGSAARATDFPITLNYNWNGMVHPGEGTNPDDPQGFRSISDRALAIDGGANSFGTSAIVGGTGITYSIVTGAGVLDIVHLGDTGPGNAKTWDAVAGNGNNLGVQPAWLVGIHDHLNPQVTTLSTPLTLDANSSIGVLYFVSNNGGAFNVVLSFSDAASATVTMAAADWFGPTNPPAALPGVASQTRLGGTTFTGTSNGDLPVTQPWPTQSLSVTEGVITVASLNGAGLGNYSGKHLSSITFQNPNPITKGYAIFATTVVTGLGPPANDNCANATLVAAGSTTTSNLRATGAATSPCGSNDTTDVWYRYTATATGPVEARTCGAAFDTTAAVYTGCAGAAIACDDNGCALASRVRWNATSGVNYLIRIAGTNAATGVFTLVIDNNPGPAHSDTPIPLAYNWNGLVHAGEAQNPEDPTGYRSIWDRGLLTDGAPGALNAGATVGTDYIRYTIEPVAEVVDTVHIGDRTGAYPFNNTPGDNFGPTPTWLVGSGDQTGPTQTDVTSLNLFMGPATRVGVIYQVSAGPGTFDCTLNFSDGSSVSVNLQGPDWYLDQSPASPNSGVEVQRQLGLFNATRDNDFASLGAPGLNVVEAVVSTTSLLSGGLGDVTGKRLNSITFGNRAPTGSSVGIYAVTVRDATPPTGSVPPSGSGSTVPNPAEAGRAILLRVAVAPGLNPTSTGLNVHADLSSMGGASNQVFYDDGTHGDVTAGDRLFSFATSVPSSQGVGAVSLPFTVADAQSRSATGTIAFSVNPFAWNESTDGGSDAGELPASAQHITGGGSLSGIRGVMSASDADMYAIYICDPANFSATTSGNGTVADTQLFLFNTAGVGVTFNDDDPSGGITSRLSNAFVTSPGLYYLAISQYDKDPVSANGALWIDTPFGVERQPDGPGAADAITGWDTGGAGAGYLISLTGVCRGNPPPSCGSADFNGDGDVGTDQDIEAFFACLAGNCCPTCETADFNGDGDVGTDQDIEAFFRVLAGGIC